MSAAVIAAAELVKALATAGPDERALVLAIIRPMFASSDVSRKRSEAGKAGAIASANARQLPQQKDGKQPGKTAALAESLPGVGGKGGSDSRISDPESTVSISESSPKLSLPEGGPKTSEAGRGETLLPEGNPLHALLPGGGSEEPGVSRPRHDPPNDGLPCLAPRACDCGSRECDARLSELRLEPVSPPTPRRFNPSAEIGAFDRWAAAVDRDNSDIPSATVPRRFNASALVEHFVAGVNEAGGVWTCAGGKPFTDLAAALQPHASRAPPEAFRKALDICSALGRRWFAYCGGAPRDAWKAAAWLGEGAPERQARPGEVTPLGEAQERAAKARRASEARKREEEYQREKETRGPPPPDIQAEMRKLFTPGGMQ